MRTIMSLIFLIAMGVQGFGVFPFMAAWAFPLQPGPSFTAPTSLNATTTSETVNENSWGFQSYLVRRESSGPPSESHSGRASSHPVDGLSESSRMSSTPLDLGADEVEKQIEREIEESHKEIGTTPKHRRDPSEGGGQSHPVIKKRRGVLD